MNLQVLQQKKDHSSEYWRSIIGSDVFLGLPHQYKIAVIDERIKMFEQSISHQVGMLTEFKKIKKALEQASSATA